MQLFELRDYIGSLLELNRFRDYCPNGLQVEGRAEVRKLATAVSASQAVLVAAANWGADALLVHHGYFWKNEDATITGIKKRRIEFLLKNELSLLAYHLPLDAHPELGNNAQLAARLGWTVNGQFGEQNLGSYGELVQPQSLANLGSTLNQILGRVPQIIGDPEKIIKRIAWCSGGAQGYFDQATALNVDAFLTGEISEQNVHVAQETGVAFIAAGHYATEQFGVQALGEHLAERWSLDHQFFAQDIAV
jgi:dinuclear metal center YbgI/SA1388 family protein